MIAFIRGNLQAKGERSIVVLTAGGVGYEVFLNARNMSMLSGKKDQIDLHILSVIREDVFDLYGFSTWEEREAFRILTGVLSGFLEFHQPTKQASD